MNNSKSNNDNSKSCIDCKVIKPLSEYHKNKQQKDGRIARCKPCANSKEREYYKKNKDHIRERKRPYVESERAKEIKRAYRKTDKAKAYSKMRNGMDSVKAMKATYAKSEAGKLKVIEWMKTEKGKSISKESSKRWKIKNPIKNKARQSLGNAVRDGKIERPSKCSVCLETARLDGHHSDYNYPLDVIWLCRQCHKDWHKENGPGLNGDRY